MSDCSTVCYDAVCVLEQLISWITLTLCLLLTVCFQCLCLCQLLSTSPKFRRLVRLVSETEVLNTCISIHNQTDVVFYLTLLIFSLNFRFMSAFIPFVTERELQTSESSVANFHQIVKVVSIN